MILERRLNLECEVILKVTEEIEARELGRRSSLIIRVEKDYPVRQGSYNLPHSGTELASPNFKFYSSLQSSTAVVRLTSPTPQCKRQTGLTIGLQATTARTAHEPLLGGHPCYSIRGDLQPLTSSNQPVFTRQGPWGVCW